MTAPVRLRLSRANGFDLQAHSLATNGLPAINVARPGPWGNPFVVGKDGDRAECVELHKNLIAGMLCLTTIPDVDTQLKHRGNVIRSLDSLTGHNLACWCSLDGPCHGNTLLELANPRCEEIKP